MVIYMGCVGACTHVHVRIAVTHMRVRAKCILKCACDVRACGPVGGAKCDRTFAHFLQQTGQNLLFYTFFSHSKTHKDVPF